MVMLWEKLGVHLLCVLAAMPLQGGVITNPSISERDVEQILFWMETQLNT